jgi:hypothetical protein
MMLNLKNNIIKKPTINLESKNVIISNFLLFTYYLILNIIFCEI